MRMYQNLYDVIIVGGGPAGLSAAIYASRAKEKVLVIENNTFGGQIALTAKVVNYPGVGPCSGKDLVEMMKTQALDFGAELIQGEIKRLELESKIKMIYTSDQTFRALSVILAPGGLPGQAGFAGETAFKGNGVSYCPTCDGPLFEDCPIYVVGGGLAAVEESIFLSGYSSNVTLVVRENDFTCEKTVSDRLKLYPDIRVLFHTEIIKVSGGMHIDQVTMRDNMSCRIYSERSDKPIGVFVFVGYRPNTDWLPSSLQKDKAGYLVTDANCRTNLTGVCAAGDVRQKSLRQVVTATADGAIAAVSLEPLIRDLHEELEIPDLVDACECLGPGSSQKAILKLWLDDTDLSQEMVTFIENQKELNGKVEIETHREKRDDILLPSIEICRSDGSSSGIHFHAVPNGLEWNSFRIALFNVMGPGQKIKPELLSRIKGIDHKINLKILATLTCGSCPTSVMSACQIAAFNENVTAEMFDIHHFKKLRYHYNVRSVPALIINEDKMIIDKMEVEEMLDAIL